MKKTIEKINETKTWFLKKNKIDKPLLRKNGRQLKSVKLEMKKDKLQITEDTTEINTHKTLLLSTYIPIKWTNYLKGTISQD